MWFRCRDFDVVFWGCKWANPPFSQLVALKLTWQLKAKLCCAKVSGLGGVSNLDAFRIFNLVHFGFLENKYITLLYFISSVWCLILYMTLSRGVFCFSLETESNEATQAMLAQALAVTLFLALLVCADAGLKTRATVSPPTTAPWPRSQHPA